MQSALIKKMTWRNKKPATTGKVRASIYSPGHFIIEFDDPHECIAEWLMPSLNRGGKLWKQFQREIIEAITSSGKMPDIDTPTRFEVMPGRKKLYLNLWQTLDRSNQKKIELSSEIVRMLDEVEDMRKAHGLIEYDINSSDLKDLCEGFDKLYTRMTNMTPSDLKSLINNQKVNLLNLMEATSSFHKKNAHTLEEIMPGVGVSLGKNVEDLTVLVKTQSSQ